jgi:hypothetical protein
LIFVLVLYRTEVFFPCGYLPNADRRAYIVAMSNEATSPIEVPRTRLRRSAAAAYLHQRLGQNVSLNTLRAWPIRYRQIGRDAVYEVADLDAFVEARLRAAPLRRTSASPPLTAFKRVKAAELDIGAVYENRLAQLRPEFSEPAARERAFQFAAEAYASRKDCDLATAARMVREALAKAKV